MTSFKEFIEDYDASEREEHERFWRGLAEGKVAPNETCPNPSRFHKLRKPVATPAGPLNIWGVIPFYGSTIVHLVPRSTINDFDWFCKETHGFSSKDLDTMISFCKDTGRLNFCLPTFPDAFRESDFLEPLLRELKPPSMLVPPFELFFGEKKTSQLKVEFRTLAELGFGTLVKDVARFVGIHDTKYLEIRLDHYLFDYMVFRLFGYDELADYLAELMIRSPSDALDYFNVLGNLIAVPKADPTRRIFAFSLDTLSEGRRLLERARLKPREVVEFSKVPHEIGKFILRKTVLYPETMSGCLQVIERYEDHQLRRVQEALYNAVNERDTGKVSMEKAELEEICESVWSEADRVGLIDKIGGLTPDLLTGVIGELASGVRGAGILAALGVRVSDMILGGRIRDAVSEQVKRLFFSDHLVTMYDFKKNIMSRKAT